MIYLLLTCKLLFTGGATQLQNDKEPASFTFESNVLTAQDGYIQLNWEAAEEITQFEVQQSPSPDFENLKTIYQGPDRASFVSGLNEGTYYFRVKAKNGPWSDTLKVNVEHQSLQLTYLLMSIGSVVFLATCAVVIVGARQKLEKPN